LPTAHESNSECFPTTFRWTDSVDEASLPLYPGGQTPYASTTCRNHGICPANWRCNKKRGCLPKPVDPNTCADDTLRFLKNIRNKDGVLIKKTCEWLRSRETNQKRKFCTKPKFSLATQGYKPAKDVCVDICDSYL